MCKLKAQLINFEHLTFTSDLENFKSHDVTHGAGWNHLMTPKMAVHVHYYANLGTDQEEENEYILREMQERSRCGNSDACCLACFKGVLPWDDPWYYNENDPNATPGQKTKVHLWNELHHLGSHEELRNRLLRMINQKLQIGHFQNTVGGPDASGEMISQDAIDVLRSILDREPDEWPT